jgi:C4-type Zn-finger protein
MKTQEAFAHRVLIAEALPCPVCNRSMSLKVVAPSPYPISDGAWVEYRTYECAACGRRKTHVIDLRA